jgi:hypothetical protein
MSTQALSKPNKGEMLETMTTFQRVVWLKAVLCCGMAAGLLLSRRLWLTDRSYPLTPVWAGLPPIPVPWDSVMFCVLIGLLLGTVIARRPKPWIMSVIGLCILLGVGDQSRWQPWFYQYLLMLMALTLFPWTQVSASSEEVEWRADAALGTCRFLIACVYLWSGIHKLNWTFVHSIFPWMTGPLAHRLPHMPWHAMAFVVPLVEFATGLGLLTVRGRPFALAAAVAMHLFILVCLGPWGLDWNSVVWPWNIAMILFVLLLFGRDRRPFLGRFLEDCLRVRRSSVPVMAMALFGVMPIFGFFGLWDSYLSVSLYSGDIQHAYFTLSRREAKHLPAAVQRLGVSDGNTIDAP